MVDGDSSVDNDIQLEPRIAYGKDAEPGDVPHSVFLSIGYPERKSNCSGSIIGQFHVITAKHCVEESPPEGIDVYVGELNRENSYDDEVFHTVLAIYKAPKTSNVFASDIAILELEFPIKFRKTLRSVGAIEPVQLPDEGSVILPGEKCLIAGWGFTNKFNKPPSRLQKLDVEVKECISTFNHTICLSLPDDNGSNICKGDYGSGLVRKKDDNSFELLAIATGHHKSKQEIGEQAECGMSQPILAEVSNYVGWIKWVMSLRSQQSNQ